jgi:hypothetical protein
MHGSTIMKFMPRRRKETKVVNTVENYLLSLENSIVISKKFIQRSERVYLRYLFIFHEKDFPLFLSGVLQELTFFWDLLYMKSYFEIGLKNSKYS